MGRGLLEFNRDECRVSELHLRPALMREDLAMLPSVGLVYWYYNYVLPAKYSPW